MKSEADKPAFDIAAVAKMWKGGEHRKAVEALIAANKQPSVLSAEIPEAASLIVETYTVVSAR